jgi:Domain of unknown function (DUF5668)
MAIQTMQQQPRRTPRESVSLFWPIMLIGAGVLLILNNMGWLHGDLLSIVINYWPVLLILAGIDILFSRSGWLGTLVSALSAIAVVLGVIYLMITPDAALSGQLTLPGSADLRTDRLTQPLGSVRDARVDLALTGGTSEIGAMIDSAYLFDGSFTHRGAYAQEVRGAGSEVTVRLGQPIGPIVAPFSAGRERMDMKFNAAVRYDMQVAIASGRHALSFTDLTLRGVRLNMASGTVDLKLPEAAPYPVEINMASGAVNITVPRGIAVRVRASGLSGAVRGDLLRRVSGNRMNGVYETPGFSTSGPHLDLKVSMLTGTVTVH